MKDITYHALKRQRTKRKRNKSSNFAKPDSRKGAQRPPKRPIATPGIPPISIPDNEPPSASDKVTDISTGYICCIVIVTEVMREDSLFLPTEAAHFAGTICPVSSPGLGSAMIRC